MNEAQFIAKVIRDLLIEISQLRGELGLNAFEADEAKSLITALEAMNE